MNIVPGSGGVTFRSAHEAEDFSYTLTPMTVNIPQTELVPSFVNADCYATPLSRAEVQYNVKINVSSPSFPGHSFVSSDPEAATVDELGYVRMQGIGGSTRVSIITAVGTRVFNHSAGNVVSNAITRFDSFLPGTLGAHIVYRINALIDGKVASNTTKDMFTSNTYSTTTPSAVRNPNMFADSLDMTGISIVGTYADEVTGGDTYMHSGFLISDRHILGAHHWRSKTRVVFMDAEGNYYIRNILYSSSLSPTYNPFLVNYDIVVSYLDAPVPNCKIFKILPPDWRRYLPSLFGIVDHKLPVISKVAHNSLGQSRDQMMINTLVHMRDPDIPRGDWKSGASDGEIASPVDSWRHPVIGGDSGGALFVPVNADNVLLGCYWGAGGGSPFCEHIEQINASMNATAVAAGEVAPSYAVQHPNLDNFRTFD